MTINDMIFNIDKKMNKNLQKKRQDFDRKR